MAPFKHLSGPINSVWKMGGCLQIPVRRMVHAETRVHGSLRWHHLKLVVLVLAKLLAPFLRASRGHPPPLAMPVPPSHSSHIIHIRVPFRRSPPQLSPRQRRRSKQEVDGKTLQTRWDWQSPSGRVPTLAHGWSPDSRSLQHAAPGVLCAATLLLNQGLRQPQVTTR